jgi:hypothetical protein
VSCIETRVRVALTNTYHGDTDAESGDPVIGSSGDLKTYTPSDGPMIRWPDGQILFLRDSVFPWWIVIRLSPPCQEFE